MGQELDCTVRHQKRTLTGKAYLETDYLLFRGEERLKIPFQSLRAVKAAGGVLTVDFAGGTAEFELGPAAAKWADKILHPPTRLTKLGVKTGRTVRLIGTFDDAFHNEIQASGAELASGRAKVDLVLFTAESARDLARVTAVAGGMKPDAALWIVYPKGVQTIREIDVLQAGREAGLTDVKVASFSKTHTALKFVIPVNRR